MGKTGMLFCSLKQVHNFSAANKLWNSYNSRMLPCFKYPALISRIPYFQLFSSDYCSQPNFLFSSYLYTQISTLMKSMAKILKWSFVTVSLQGPTTCTGFYIIHVKFWKYRSGGVDDYVPFLNYRHIAKYRRILEMYLQISQKHLRDYITWCTSERLLSHRSTWQTLLAYHILTEAMCINNKISIGLNCTFC